MLGEFLWRLSRLHRLLWMDERMTAMESQVVTLRGRLDRIRDQLDLTRDQLDRTIDQLGYITDQLDRTIDQVDLLKSSAEVPQELVDEFFEWKTHNPIPERPLVTVAVSTYNRARLLTERCIPSVLNQTYDNLELIVVGDGCTDKTEEAVAEIDDPRLRFVNLPERGSYPEDADRRWMVAGTVPTNEALAMAEGYFVTHLDDDDEYLPDRLRRLVEFSIENDCDFVWHPFWWESDIGRWILHEAQNFALGQVTNLSIFYRAWFTKFEANIHAYRLREPGDWNRLRRIKYIDPVCMRYPEPLSKHYRERSRIN